MLRNASVGAFSYRIVPTQIEAWARQSKDRLSSNPELNEESMRWILELQHAKAALDSHTSLLELLRDEDFQADIREQRVVKAINAVREDPSSLGRRVCCLIQSRHAMRSSASYNYFSPHFYRYREDPIIIGVIRKLKNFQVCNNCMMWSNLQGGVISFFGGCTCHP